MSNYLINETTWTDFVYVFVCVCACVGGCAEIGFRIGFLCGRMQCVWGDKVKLLDFAYMCVSLCMCVVPLWLEGVGVVMRFFFRSCSCVHECME